jgi:hypothetical protein
MKRLTLGLVCVLCLAPQLASAALSLQIGPQSSPASPDTTFVPVPPGGQQFFDLIFNETDPVEANEGLFAYDLAMRLVRPAGVTGGVNLAGIQAAPDNFVLGSDAAKYTFSVATSTADEVLANVSSNNDLFPINNGQKAARVFYTIAPDAPFGNYTIAFDSASTVFGSGDPQRPEVEIHVNLTDAGVIGYIPEPGALGLLGVGGLLALRRRR